jgi:hypothetical protein
MRYYPHHLRHFIPWLKYRQIRRTCVADDTDRKTERQVGVTRELPVSASPDGEKAGSRKICHPDVKELAVLCTTYVTRQPHWNLP